MVNFHFELLWNFEMRDLVAGHNVLRLHDSASVHGVTEYQPKSNVKCLVPFTNVVSQEHKLHPPMSI
jgi:hypothetical protein